LFNLTEYKLN